MKLLILFALINGFITVCLAQKITVALEPFPPFISKDGSGLTVDMLREIEKISQYEFDVQIMTYARAKHELKFNRIDIAGHTPKDLETTSFYQYAQELEWKIDTTSDLFSFDAKYFDLSLIRTGRIGTTTGNSEFLAQQLGINKNLFIEVKDLNHLISMFIKRRIDVLVFERASVMTLLQNKGVANVLYKSIGEVPASIAVSKSVKGDMLKNELDKLIKQLDFDKIFSSYYQYYQLAEQGIVPIKM